MSTGTARQQSRLLPYLLVILVVLLAYLVYTRVLQRPAPPAAVVTTPPPTAATTAPGQPEASPAPAASPAASPAPATSPAAAVVPGRPSGRSNPFAALVVERPPAPPSPPAAPGVPPPFFPGRPGEGAGGGGTKLAGVLIKDGEALAILQLGQATYIVAEGDVVEQFRVARIEPERVVLRSGAQEVSLELLGGEQR